MQIFDGDHVPEMRNICKLNWENKLKKTGRKTERDNNKKHVEEEKLTNLALKRVDALAKCAHTRVHTHTQIITILFYARLLLFVKAHHTHMHYTHVHTARKGLRHQFMYRGSIEGP